jgi:transcriptional regulator with XRE-family HTH domain
MTETVAHHLNQRIASRVRELRTAQHLSLEALAERSGVSRSMISTIERGESSPTAVLLERLATGLGVPLASLFDRCSPHAQPVQRFADQVVWRDPASGYVRRNVSPPGFPSPIQIVAVDFPPGRQVAYETSARALKVHQQVWVLDGEITVGVGDIDHDLQTGDCLAFAPDQPITFRNQTKTAARYAVIIVSHQ